jgi:uncharacterized membrane protein (UPF0127 family)
VPKKTRKFNYTLPIVIVVIALIVAAALLASGGDKPKKTAPASKTVTAVCGSYKHDGVMTLNNHKIFVEIASDSKAKAKGLAGRPCIPADQGMLFDFGKEGQYAFWMKGMNFPIDIVWISSNHRIAAIEPNILPSTYHSANPYFENDPQHPARYVLEIKANQAAQMNLDLGQPVSFQKT